MITILTWVSIFAGGILILLLILSLIAGLDFELDIGSTDGDVDSGGLGVIKGFLTFVSVSSWVIKMLLVSNKNPTMAIVIGIICGLFAFFLLNLLLQLLLRNEENVNWAMEDAMYQSGEVYLKIPEGDGNGIVQVEINGANRELKAKSKNNEIIQTGSAVRVVDITGEYVIVTKESK